MGPPGSGKGTVGQALVESSGYQRFSTGDALREHSVRGTELGKRVSQLLQAGQLVSDDIVIELIKDWLHEHINQTNTFIFDGFPRTLLQAKLLQELLNQINQTQEIHLCVLCLQVRDDMVVQRIAHRLICTNKACCCVYSAASQDAAPSNCEKCGGPLVTRVDDTNGVMLKRLATYKLHERELIEFYQQACPACFSMINGEQSIKQVIKDSTSFIERCCYDSAKK